MTLLATLAHRGARRMIVVNAATVLSTAAIAYAAGAGLVSAAPPYVALGLAGAIALGGGWRLAQALGRLTAWDNRLTALATAKTEDLALELETVSGSTPADQGWNRLAEQGRRWQALTELEQAVASRLAGRGLGDAAPLLDALPEGVAAINSAGLITYANAVTAAMCGLESAEQLLGLSLAEAVGADPATAAQLNDRAHPAQCVVEWSLTATGGGNRTLRGVRRPVAGGDGRDTAFVWSIRDVTQQRLAEAMRDKFLSAATHEFRTPLANIRAYAESLDMGHDIDAEARKRFYNVIQSESLRLSQLVDDLLDISRMQAGALALESRETDLGRLVEEASAKVQGQMREKQLQFRCELPPKFPKAAVDKSKLAAALVNLLGNAAKYTPAGGRVTFRVDIAPERVQFSVSDTGIGIAPEELPRVFERFYRSSDDRVREITGSGLGLALSQEIARLHGGDITVESALNKGSTFRMSIPLDSAA